MSHFSDDELRWVEQWRYAAIALEELRGQELRALTDAEARIILRQVMSTPGPDASSSHTSGLVEQQRLFHSKP